MAGQPHRCVRVVLRIAKLGHVTSVIEESGPASSVDDIFDQTVLPIPLEGHRVALHLAAERGSVDREIAAFAVNPPLEETGHLPAVVLRFSSSRSERGALEPICANVVGMQNSMHNVMKIRFMVG